MRRQQMVEALIGLAAVTGSVGMAAWTLVSGQIRQQGLDALFQVLACLLIAAVFSPIAVRAVRRLKKGAGEQGR